MSLFDKIVHLSEKLLEEYQADLKVLPPANYILTVPESLDMFKSKQAMVNDLQPEELDKLDFLMENLFKDKQSSDVEAPKVGLKKIVDKQSSNR